ncbi:MAG: ribulokinase [Clostridiales bacterium]|nr:ribulokinase [Clostridiales bacterium]
MGKYSIGLDFGSLSGRALLVEVETGREVATAIMEYPHGVMDEKLPDGTKLGVDWALQHPQDYLDVLQEIVPSVMMEAAINPKDVIGIGVDFTACTILPIDDDGEPLCFMKEYRTQPHAYVKLWKHHAAQDEANRLNEIAKNRGEKFLKRYGGKISSEWLVPKIWQIINEAPEIYERADRFIEAGDWLVLQMTGEEKRSSCSAGYKGLWHKQEAYPSKEFFKALDTRLENLVEEKLSTDIYPIGSKAGELTESAAKLLGLNPGTPVAVSIIDAHAAVPAAGITEEGKMLMVMGTSTCHMVLDKEEKLVPGVGGIVEDGMIPGYFAYEAGQACVGDHFEWFVDNCVPLAYHEEAKERAMNLHSLLTEKANKLAPGESGLIALDWWNGNRSILADGDLTGLLIGCTLRTKPEEIYRALIEATAFGTRMIIDTFEENHISIQELYAAGGIAEKNQMLMQIYADVTNREIKISASSQTSALGSAMLGALAAGESAGGYDSIQEAARNMTSLKDLTYKPIPQNTLIYDLLYKDYKKLHDHFGLGMNNVMKRLKDYRRKTS